MIYKPGNCKNFFTTYFGIRKPTKLFLHWSISLEEKIKKRKKENYDAWVFVLQKYGKSWSISLWHFIRHKPLIIEEYGSFLSCWKSVYTKVVSFKNNISWNVPYLTAFSRKFSSMFDHLQIHSSFITILVYLDSRIKNKNFCQDLFFFLQAYASFWKNYKKYI